MKARPILFSSSMIRALLAGTKTQTRRTIKPQPDCGFIVGGPGSPACPYGVPGDLLWVKESWAYRLDHDHLNGTQLHEAGVRRAWYWADGPGKRCNTGCAGAAGRVRSSRFMPRWASRITLRITEVRVQRLQVISERDALAEGITKVGRRWEAEGICATPVSAVDAYGHLWQFINGAGSWQANPFVWALTFEVLQKNVDEVLCG